MKMCIGQNVFQHMHRQHHIETALGHLPFLTGKQWLSWWDEQHQISSLVGHQNCHGAQLAHHVRWMLLTPEEIGKCNESVALWGAK